jgi:hypothetical protein
MRRRTTRSTTAAKPKRTPGRRRAAVGRAMSSKPSQIATDIGLTIAGMAIAGVVGSAIPIANPKAKAAIITGAGIFGAMKLKGMPRSLAMGAGLAGAQSLIKSVVPGIPSLGAEEAYTGPSLTAAEEAAYAAALGYDVGEIAGDYVDAPRMAGDYVDVPRMGAETGYPGTVSDMANDLAGDEDDADYFEEIY